MTVKKLKIESDNHEQGVFFLNEIKKQKKT